MQHRFHFCLVHFPQRTKYLINVKQLEIQSEQQQQTPFISNKNERES